MIQNIPIRNFSSNTNENISSQNLAKSILEGTITEVPLSFLELGTRIPPYLFYETNIKNIEIPGNIKTIGNFSFSRTTLETVTFNSGLIEIDAQAFMECSQLKSLDLPDSVTFIGSTCFQNCSSLETVKLPSYLSSIESSLFRGCEKLSEIVLPETILKINTYAFNGCTSLKKINIPNTVSAIGGSAFNQTGLEGEIIIPPLVTSIKSSTFRVCPGITKVVLPANIVSIGEMAFDGCTSLEVIQFEGTVEQWNAIELGNIWNRDTLATEVICSDGTVIL